MSKNGNEKNSLTELDIDLPNSIKKLSPFNQTFVMNYVKTGDADESYKTSRKIHKMPIASSDVARRNSMLLLMDKTIKDSIQEYRGAYKEAMTTIYSNSGVDIAKIFSDLATNQDELDRIDKRIKRYDDLIEEAQLAGDITLETMYSKDQLMYIRQRDKFAESARKNASVINDIIGDSKQKQIVKADSITINMGNQTIVEGSNTSKHLESIDAEIKVIDEDAPDIKDLGGING